MDVECDFKGPAGALGNIDVFAKLVDLRSVCAPFRRDRAERTAPRGDGREDRRGRFGAHWPVIRNSRLSRPATRNAALRYFAVFLADVFTDGEVIIVSV